MPRKSSRKPRKRTTRRSARKPEAATAPQPTIIYVHGMGQRKSGSELKDIWDHALFGRRMGERTHMAYWADVIRPEQATGTSSLSHEINSLDLPGTDEELYNDCSKAAPPSKPAQDFARKLTARLIRQNKIVRGRGVAAASVHAKINFPNWLTRWFTRTFTGDVAAYLFDKPKKRAIQQRLITWLKHTPGPVIVVSHSQGTMVAYDVLHALKRQKIDVPLWVTLGSPLGLEEVQEHITQPLRVPEIVGKWCNFAANLDVVAIDPTLKDDFKPARLISDFKFDAVPGIEWLGGNPHAIEGYLANPQLKKCITDVVGTTFADATVSFVVAKDLVGEMQTPDVRTPVLIELSEKQSGATLAEKGRRVAAKIIKLTRGVDAAEIELLKRFVAARLTPAEIMQLRASTTDLQVRHMWRDSTKRALLDKSTGVLHSRAAESTYDATGKGIAWAVLDTGIEDKHPHFKKVVAAKWDCTKRGPLTASKKKAPDGDGHGTHVAGIISGTDADSVYQANAPQCRLHVYKVLKDDGSGQDSYIIKALDHIAALNENSPELVIHGVNLSLGGYFDPEVYGCGFSPLCNELRRLWRQGVMVCIAAGNEGMLTVRTLSGAQEINLDLSIGDPANLEEAIAVGSVHKEFPHLYGISYFSSRGPTADGRLKPDVVAPGEKILSANAGWVAGASEPYIAMSGTSMACPQVSGLLAAFLSVRQEFIGYPDRVKEILLETCVDLERDVNFQGAGVPNLMKMLLET